MSIGDFIDDPFGAVAKVGLDAFTQGGINGENADVVGGFEVPDVRSMTPFFGDDKSDPYQLGGVGEQPSEPYVDNSGPQIIHPDPMPDTAPEPSTAADDAAGYGAAGEVDGGTYDIF